MLNSSHDLPQKSLQIKQDDKFFSRLLSKESSMANPSFRVYYGGLPGAVPFLWESQPGTPKYSFCETTLPPLTPPPSYYFDSIKKPMRKSSRSNLLHTIFSKMNRKKAQVSSSSTPSLSISSNSSCSSSSKNSSMFVPMISPSNFHGRSRFSSPRSSSSFDSRMDDEEQAIGSPTSTLCFGNGRESTARGGPPRGCYSVVLMKKALLSMVGHGSGEA